MSSSDRCTPRIAPWLSVRRGAEAVAYYHAAFGAVELHHHENEAGEIVSQLSVGGAEFWVADDSELSPETLGGASARMILAVDDPDALFDRAVAAGATVIAPIYEGHGWRIGRLRDPFGHHWEIGKPLG
jgi:PhnB protein